MNKTNIAADMLARYRQGERYFEGLEIENESFEGENLENVFFDNCALYVSFARANLTNAKFMNGSIKTCDFRDANLSNATFKNLHIEESVFAGSVTTGVHFENNYAYGQRLTQQDFDTWLKNE